MREKQIAQQVKEADSNQKVSQTDFLMQMEKRLSEARDADAKKGVQQQKMMQDEHTNNVKNALATHGIKVKETVAAGKKPEPAPIESGLVRSHEEPDRRGGRSSRASKSTARPPSRSCMGRMGGLRRSSWAGRLASSSEVPTAILSCT